MWVHPRRLPHPVHRVMEATPPPNRDMVPGDRRKHVVLFAHGVCCAGLPREALGCCLPTDVQVKRGGSNARERKLTVMMYPRWPPRNRNNVQSVFRCTIVFRLGSLFLLPSRMSTNCTSEKQGPGHRPFHWAGARSPSAYGKSCGTGALFQSLILGAELTSRPVSLVVQGSEEQRP